MQTLFSRLTDKEVNAFIAVLASENIPYTTEKAGNRWRIVVSDDDAVRALAALSEYMHENRAWRESEVPEDSRFPKTLSGVWVAAMFIAVYIASGGERELKLFIDSFGASASRIVNGEYYRTATALLFHGDAAHLSGNIFGIILFGTAVCSITGWGVGWLMILVTGMAGNLLNAYFYQAGHMSIGASTAVFGAVGILSGYQFMNRSKHLGWRKSAWLPIAGGIALLAALGAGEYTDIMAHLFGFASGLVLGMGYSVIVAHPAAAGYQYLCIVIAIGTLIDSWIKGSG